MYDLSGVEGQGKGKLVESEEKAESAGKVETKKDLDTRSISSRIIKIGEKRTYSIHHNLSNETTAVSTMPPDVGGLKAES